MGRPKKKLDPLIPLDDLKKVVQGLVPPIKPKTKPRRKNATKKR